MIIREYQPQDRKALVKLVENFQDYLVKIDPLKRLRREPAYGQVYTQRVLKQVRNDTLFVAEESGRPVGFIAGIIQKQPKWDLLQTPPTKAGRITELYLEPDYRRKKLGTQLIEKMEAWLKTKGCDILRVEVFAPNKSAHAFYHKRMYADRSIDLIKKI